MNSQTIIHFKRPLILHCRNVPEISSVAIVDFNSDFHTEIARHQASFDAAMNADLDSMRFQQSAVGFFPADNIDLHGVLVDQKGKEWAISETDVYVREHDRLFVGQSWIEVSRVGFSWIAELPFYGKKTRTMAVGREILSMQIT